MAEGNVAIVRRGFDEVWNRGQSGYHSRVDGRRWDNRDEITMMRAIGVKALPLAAAGS